MKAFKVHNVEKVKQEVNLPAGTYTYSCRVIPIGTSYTFKLDNQSFTFEGLTAGVLNKRMKHTFELTETVSFFYLSDTVGDCVFEPQIEEGVFATTPGAHPLDFERLISEAGIEIDHEALSLYAKKADVSAEIKIQTDRIDSTVGNISNDVDGVKGDITTISQTVNSITSTVTNHTTQISTFQQTVDQIYASIEDVGSGEFSYILQRIDQIEMKVGAPGQNGSIQVALDSIALTVYDENTGLSAISQTVNSISSTVYDKHGALLSQISQDGSNVKITASQIELEGLVTANNNFKILEDGSIEAKNGKFTGEINATSGSFTGTVNATLGKIGGFDISGNELINAATDARISFNGLDGGQSFIRLNTLSSMIAIRSDVSNKTGLNISTYATGAVGLSVRSNAGSALAIRSVGGHFFYQRSSEVWSAPGILAAVELQHPSNSVYQTWAVSGVSASNSAFTINGGVVTWTHNLGHQNYVLLASSHASNGGVVVGTKANNTVTFTVSRHDANERVHLLLIGRNKYIEV